MQAGEDGQFASAHASGGNDEAARKEGCCGNRASNTLPWNHIQLPRGDPETEDFIQRRKTIWQGRMLLEGELHGRKAISGKGKLR